MDNFQISKNFSFYEMTKTNSPEFVQKNRIEGYEQINKLGELVRLMEKIRDLAGAPLEVHSGYRCQEVNDLVGGAVTSQHTKCEACDFSLLGPETKQTVDNLFSEIVRFAAGKKMNFGQLINESQDRGYSKNLWIHVSLGFPYREKDKCGEILRMVNGSYETLGRVQVC